jgi:hypothetical protein
MIRSKLILSLTSGIVAGALLWAVASPAPDHYAKIDASSLVRSPQNSWARAILFTDVLETVPSGRTRRLDRRNYLPMRLKTAGTVWVNEDLAPTFANLTVGNTYSFGGTVDQISRRYYVIVDACFAVRTASDMSEHWTDMLKPGAQDVLPAQTASGPESTMQALLIDAQNSLINMAHANNTTVAELVGAQADGGKRIAEQIVADSLHGHLREENTTADELMIGAVLALLQKQAVLEESARLAEVEAAKTEESAAEETPAEDVSAQEAAQDVLPPEVAVLQEQPIEEQQTEAVAAQPEEPAAEEPAPEDVPEEQAIIEAKPEDAAISAEELLEMLPEEVPEEEAAIEAKPEDVDLVLEDLLGTLPDEGADETIPDPVAEELEPIELVATEPESVEQEPEDIGEETAIEPIAAVEEEMDLDAWLEAEEDDAVLAEVPALPEEDVDLATTDGFDSSLEDLLSEIAPLPEVPVAVPVQPETPVEELLVEPENAPVLGDKDEALVEVEDEPFDDWATTEEELFGEALDEEPAAYEETPEAGAPTDDDSEAMAAIEELPAVEAETSIEFLPDPTFDAAYEQALAEEQPVPSEPPALESIAPAGSLLVGPMTGESATIVEIVPMVSTEPTKAELKEMRRQEALRIREEKRQAKLEARRQAAEAKRIAREEKIAAEQERARQKEAERQAALEARRIAEEQARAEAEARKLEEELRRAEAQRIKEEEAARIAAEKEALREAARAEAEAQQALREKERELAEKERLALEAVRERERLAAEEERARIQREETERQLAEIEARKLAAAEALRQAEAAKQAEIERIERETAERMAAEAAEREARIAEELARKAEALRMAQEVAAHEQRAAEEAAARIQAEVAARQAAEERLRQIEEETRAMERQARETEAAARRQRQQAEREIAEQLKAAQEAERAAVQARLKEEARLAELAPRENPSQPAPPVVIAPQPDISDAYAPVTTPITDRERRRRENVERRNAWLAQKRAEAAQAKADARAEKQAPAKAEPQKPAPAEPAADPNDLPEWMQPVRF